MYGNYYQRYMLSYARFSFYIFIYYYYITLEEMTQKCTILHIFLRIDKSYLVEGAKRTRFEKRANDKKQAWRA